jgi:hypothetical protein
MYLLANLTPVAVQRLPSDRVDVTLLAVEYEAYVGSTLLTGCGDCSLGFR